MLHFINPDGIVSVLTTTENSIGGEFSRDDFYLHEGGFYLGLLVGWFVSRIVQKLLDGFQNSVGGCGMVQGRNH